MTSLIQDIRFGLRMLIKNKRLTLTIAVLLGIGIAANTVIFSVINAVLLRPLPYNDAHRLVRVYQTKIEENNSRTSVSYPNFADLCDQNQVFEGFAVYYGAEWRQVRTGDSMERINAIYISSDFFSTLGVKPILGRTFLPDEHQPGGKPVVILNHDYWMNRFSSDPNILGQSIFIDNQPFTVVGITPPNFRFEFTRQNSLWIPLSCLPGMDTVNRGKRFLATVGRLKPGIARIRAQEDLNLIAEHLEQAYPDSNKGVHFSVLSLNEVYARLALEIFRKELFFVLQAIAGLVLLVACINAANLLLAKVSSRQKEIAIRSAVGAGRLRIFQQLLVESVLLAGFGGVLGVFLTVWSIDSLVLLKPYYIPWYADVAIDTRVLLFALLISLMTGLLFGLTPALVGVKTNLTETLKEGSRRLSGGFRSYGLLNYLVTSQIAIAFVLLIAAGLTIHRYLGLLTIDPGYDRENVITARIELDWLKPPYSQPQRCLAFFQEVQDRIKNLPGTQVVSAANSSPLGGTGNMKPCKIDGYTNTTYNELSDFDKSLPDRDHFWIPYWELFPDYFRALKTPLIQGRHFTDQDTAAASPVVIINQSMMRRFWPNESPIGRYITFSDRKSNNSSKDQSKSSKKPTSIAREIVGVVGDVKHIGRGKPGDPEVYIPYLQSGFIFDMTLFIRTNFDPGSMISSIKKEVATVDSNVVINSIRTLYEQFYSMISPQRLTMIFLGVPALTALLLASIGIYGLIAFFVSQHTQEIGIRMALGATRNEIMKMVVRQVMKPTLIGVGLGLLGAFAITRVISNMLYGITPMDPITYFVVFVVLNGVTLLACYLPARRAARVDPMTALRCE
ncbi:MAG: ABC transporter permease [Candidatus Omnitrophota bacterium]